MTLSDSYINLQFYTKRVCQFKVKDVQKRLIVLIFHQSFEPMNSLETLYRGGLKNAIPSMSDIFSLRGMSFMAFLCLLGLLTMNQTWCKDIVEARR